MAFCEVHHQGFSPGGWGGGGSGWEGGWGVLWVAERVGFLQRGGGVVSPATPLSSPNLLHHFMFQPKK